MNSEILDRAAQFYRQGRFADAERAAREAMRAQPRSADPVYLLGLVCLQQRRFDEAATHIAAAIDLSPNVAEYHANLGQALRSQNRLDKACAAFERALQIQPGYSMARVNLGSVRRQQGRLDDAVAHLQIAVKNDPRIFPAWLNLGNALRDQNKLSEALAAYRRAGALDPKNADAHSSAASVLADLNRPADAKSEFDIALGISPRHLPTLINYGLLLRAQNDFDGAIAILSRALELEPNSADAHERFARVLFAACRFDEAIQHYQRAMQLSPSPHLRMTIATLIPPVYRSIDEVRWWRERLEREVAALHGEKFKLEITDRPPPSTFYLPYQGLADREIARQIADLCVVKSEIQIHKPAVSAGRIRVAFISSLFKDQTVGLWMQGLIATLWREKFEVIVISTTEPSDGVGNFIRKHADKYIVVPSSLPLARQTIAGVNADVLIYADIGMVPFTAALAHARLAPVQCAMWGHPITTGIATIDYFISCALAEDENAQDNYTEKLALLPNLPLFYYRPQPPAETVNRYNFDLAGDVNLYGCLQAQYKLHPSFDEAIAGILRADQNGLLLLSRGGTARGEDVISDRLRSRFPDIVDRVRFMPTLARDRFRGLLSLCDVLLAPFPFGAGDSSLEGFALDLPTVTLPTPFLKGRLTHAMYRLMKIDDCVARDLDDYVKIAVKLGTDRAFNQSVREKIRATCSILYENEAGVRDLEAFLLNVARATSP